MPSRSFLGHVALKLFGCADLCPTLQYVAACAAGAVAVAGMGISWWVQIPWLCHRPLQVKFQICVLAACVDWLAAACMHHWAESSVAYVHVPQPWLKSYPYCRLKDNLGMISCGRCL